MRLLCCLFPCLVLVFLAACGREPGERVWTTSDTVAVSQRLAAGLLESTWRSEARAAGAVPAVAIAPVTGDTGGDGPDAERLRRGLERRLIDGGQPVLAAAAAAAADAPVLELVVQRRWNAEDGTRDYHLDARLLGADRGAVLWADAVVVTKAAPASTPIASRGGKAQARDRRQSGDRIGSVPAPQATQDTIGLTVTRDDVSEARLLDDLAAIRRVGGVRTVEERVDERGVARLTVYVEPHREIEVRRRLLDMGWTPIRY